ncbi:MAG TPA: hypothetical protein VMM18_00965 [Gemmatimonadaceae bacterium]|nr:hypothetical protein [Gemmatimonadaceae bacterium]
MRRPLGIQMLASLLAIYAMGGVFIALTMLDARDARLDWLVIVLASATFAASAGSASHTVWRLERAAPLRVVLCGACGAAFCLLLPLATPARIGAAVWPPALIGAVMFLAFVLLAAHYVERQLRAARGRRGALSA